MLNLEGYKQIWLVDFEFGAPEGHPPAPRCVVAREFHSGEERRVWLDVDQPPRCPPYPVDASSLFIAFSAQAELSCHLTLGWPLPVRIIDLFPEFCRMTNVHRVKHGRSLLHALRHFGLDAMDSEKKDWFRDLALRGGPYSETERSELMAYCAEDVRALAVLLPKMLPYLDGGRSLLRGHYSRAVAAINVTGVPVDARFAWMWNKHRTELRQHVLRERDQDGFHDPSGTFRYDKAAAAIRATGRVWPRTKGTRRYSLAKDVLKSLSEGHAPLERLYELRRLLAAATGSDFVVGPDARVRAPVWPYSTVTGRNQTNKRPQLFGLPSWMRGAIAPAPGHTLAYIDWGQQEFGIAAVLSGDNAMLSTYQSDDPYVAFGIEARLLPEGASKQSHPKVRAQLKACALGVLYGKTAHGLSQDLDITHHEAQQLLRAHRRAYPTFWEWIEGVVTFADIQGYALSRLGWRLRPGPEFNERTFRNYPMQANAAEMMRLAAGHAHDRGVRVCAIVHDAFLIEVPSVAIDTAVADMRSAMNEASTYLLDGVTLKTDVDLIDDTSRMLNDEQRETWEWVYAKLEELEQQATGQ